MSRLEGSRGRRFWLLYVCAWVPYLGVYASLFVISGEASPVLAFLAALNNVLPAALLGFGVVWACTRITWGPERVGRALLGHLVLAILYAALTSLLAAALFVVTWPLFEGRVAWGSFHLGILAWQAFMALMIYAILASITHAFLTTARLREEEHRAAQAEALKARAELQALRAQLNPHFLFNTLHSLIALVRSDSAAAEDAIEQFADLLRYASRVHQETRDEVTLAEEWEFVQNYLALESLRIGERLRVDADVAEDAVDCVVPSFCLQPLVENSVRHAIAPRAAGGLIRIRATVDDSMLHLEVSDNGPGADPDAPRSNGRLGLRLVRQRLRALYGDRAVFSVETAPGRGFTVRITVPLRRRPISAMTMSVPWSGR